MYVGTSKASQQRVSIKEFHIKSNDADMRLIQREVSILNKLSGHETIPKLYELFLTENAMFVVTQYVDLFRLKNYIDLKSEKVVFSLAETRKIVKKLLNAIEHCHSHFIVLRCLTPENILVKKLSDNTATSTAVPFNNNSNTANTKEKVPEYEVILTDMSLAVAWDGEDASEPLQNHSSFDWSLLPYCSPEIVTRGPVSPATDMWSLGVLVYLLVGGNLPFVVPDMLYDRAQLVDKIAQANFSFSAQSVWTETRLDVRNVVTSLLHSDPTQRSTASELKANTWLLRG